MTFSSPPSLSLSLTLSCRSQIKKIEIRFKPVSFFSLSLPLSISFFSFFFPLTIFLFFYLYFSLFLSLSIFCFFSHYFFSLYFSFSSFFLYLSLFSLFLFFSLTISPFLFSLFFSLPLFFFSFTIFFSLSLSHYFSIFFIFLLSLSLFFLFFPLFHYSFYLSLPLFFFSLTIFLFFFLLSLSLSRFFRFLSLFCWSIYSAHFIAYISSRVFEHHVKKFVVQSEGHCPLEKYQTSSRQGCIWPEPCIEKFIVLHSQHWGDAELKFIFEITYIYIYMRSRKKYTTELSQFSSAFIFSFFSFCLNNTNFMQSRKWFCRKIFCYPLQKKGGRRGRWRYIIKKNQIPKRKKIMQNFSSHFLSHHKYRK